MGRNVWELMTRAGKKVGDESSNALVKTFLGSLINEKLRKNLPGLYATLTMLTYGRFGEYPGELLYRRPEEFVRLLSDYLMDEMITNRILNYLLEDLVDKGKYGREAVNSLLRGEYEDFRRLAEKAVIKEAIKWSRRLIS